MLLCSAYVCSRLGVGMLSVGVALFAAALHGPFQMADIVIPGTYLHLIG